MVRHNVVHDIMKRTITILTLALLLGCGRSDWVLVDAVRENESVIVNQKVFVRDLALTLAGEGFSTNTPVFFTANPVNHPMWTNNLIRIRHPKDWTHQQLRDAMDQLERNRVGLWPDSFTGKTRDAQHHPAPYPEQRAVQER